MTFRISIGTFVVQSPEQVSSELDEGAVILHATEGQYYGLDEIGTRVWALIAAPGSTVGDVVDILLKEYDVDRERCTADVCTMLGRLLTAKLIEVRPTDSA